MKGILTDQTVQTPDGPLVIPPGKAYMTVGDLPESFMNDVLMRAFSDYSVALSRVRQEKADTFTPLGTGVLVRKGNRHGVLTAHHCLHACRPECELGVTGGDRLTLILRGDRGVQVESHEVVEHVLARPRTDEFGPDLTFIEVLAPERLASLKAIGSFWSLDRPDGEVFAVFGTALTPVVTIGFPEFDYKTDIDGNNIHHLVRHMSYANSIGSRDVTEREDWDYLDSTIRYPGADIPPSFTGVSGGPVWGYEMIHKKATDTLTIGKHALVGITFYQTALENNQRRLRAHFIKSIYERAWRGVL
jgi:hypothetical protein